VPTQSAAGTRLLAFGRGYDRLRGSGQVRALQRLLARAGDEPGPIDGRYGPLTERAVTRFQAEHGLEVDGIAGPHTLAALNSPTPALYPGAGYGEPAGSGLVRALQRLLARAGDEPGPIDGRYGPLTERAVTRFQAHNRLEVDGIAGRVTFVQLRKQGLPPHTPRHALGSRPRLVHRHPARVHGTTNTRRTSHPAVWPADGLPVVFVGLGLAMLFATARFLRLRRRERLVVWPKTRSNRHHTVPIEPDTSNGHHAAAVAPNTSNGHHAAAVEPNTSNGGHHAAAIEPDTSNGHHAAAVEPNTSNGVPRVAEKDLTSTQAASVQVEDEGNANLAFNHGGLLEGRGDLAGAEAAYRRADDRGHAAAACNLGALLEGRGDLAGAEVAYNRADHRGDANGAFNLGVLLEGRGDLAGAEAAYGGADDRGHAAAACNLGVLLEGRGDLTGAQAAYRRADHRGDANGAFNLGALLEDRSDLTGAEAAYRRAEQRGHAEVANMARSALLDLRMAAAGPHGPNGGVPDVQ
jgi:peptidoglycan hydrolase-like protein with peptidoglycan-binding domain/TPR repeat protein